MRIEDICGYVKFQNWAWHRVDGYALVPGARATPRHYINDEYLTVKQFKGWHESR